MQLQNINNNVANQETEAFKVELRLVEKKIRYKFPNLQFSRDDMLMVHYYEKKFGADILSNELSLFPRGGKNVIHVTIYLQRRIARKALGNYSLNFIFVIKEKDGHFVQREFLSSDDNVIGCTAVLEYYDNQKNHYLMNNYVLLKEYRSLKEGSIWNSKPIVMLKKVAEASVLRMVVPEMQNMYIKEEFDKDSNNKTTEVVKIEEFDKDSDNTSTEIVKIEEIQLNNHQKVSITDEEYKTIIDLQKRLDYQIIRSKEDIEDWLTKKQLEASKYIIYLNKRIEAKQYGIRHW
jgi:hypothetical protein